MTGSVTPKRPAVVFSPYPLRTDDSGAHKRTRSIARGLVQLGYDVRMVWLNNVHDPATATHHDDQLVLPGIGPVTALKYSRWDFHAGRWIKRGRQWLGDRDLASDLAHSPWLTRSFRRLVKELQPEVVVTNNSAWTRLLPPRKNGSPLYAIDCFDLVSTHSAMVDAVRPYFPDDWTFPEPDHPVLSERFFDGVSQADPQEFGSLDRYDLTLAISSLEAEAIRARSQRTRVQHLPMVIDPVAVENRYDGPALFAMHRHPFNAQAYAYFVQRVLPRVKLTAPDFELKLIGRGSEQAPAADGVIRQGYVADIQAEYAAARFVVVPLLGGTGQIIRIIEAMAHGVAVIATQAAARSSPIVHGVNGFITASPEEMATAVDRLWREPGLARRMGANARQTVIDQFSEQHLVARLDQFLREARSR